MHRNEASTIFKARTRMTKVKCNYKNMFKNNLSCRACGQAEETQDHVLSRCQIIHNDNRNKVASDEFFEDDPDKLKKVAFRIDTTMTILETFNHYPLTNPVNPTAAARPGHCGVPAPALNSDGDGTAQRTGRIHNS